MIKRLGDLIDRLSIADADRTEVGAREGDLRIATAVLLMAVAQTDMQLDQSEIDRMVGLLGAHFDLTADEARTLVEIAEQRAEALVSLQTFTRQLHEQLSDAEKRHVVEMLWRVVIADGVVDRYEAHLANKIARLLYLREADVAMVRVKVLDELQPQGRGND
jgi:uncharacterized tellurite resistance protein B-like protein